MDTAIHTFDDDLLAAVLHGIVVKKKSITAKGRFDIEAGSDELGEWLRFIFRRARGPTVVVELMGEHVAQVYVRSARRQDRGRILFRLEELWLPANPSRIVGVVLLTFELGGYDLDGHGRLEREWRGVSLQIVER